MLLSRLYASCSDSFYRQIRNSEFRGRKPFDAESQIADLNNKFNSCYVVDKKHHITITDISNQILTLVVAYNSSRSGKNEIEKTIHNLVPEIEIVKSEEISLAEYKRELARANQMEWIRRSDEYFMKELGLKVHPDGYSFFDGAPYKIVENVYSANGVSKKKSLQQLSEIMASDSFYQEIERIYSSENEKKFMGHPVHYLISAGDKAAADEMIGILIPALMKNKRLLGGRVCDVQQMTARAHREENFYNIFSASQGSTVVINLALEGDNGPRASSHHELLDYISKKIAEYGKETLFIFVDISGKRNISDDAVAAILANADMIQINEGFGDKAKASEYLMRLAEKTDYDDYEVADLVKYLPEDKTEYTVTDIYRAYNKWYGSGLKTHVYKAYKEQDIVRLEVKNKESKPYEVLQNMIGLTDVKRVVDEILATARVQRMRKSLGLKENSNSLHMMFSGNPGTAKTTVARLIAQILKDEEVLKNGHLVECGRQDLVGKYVGWTARIVEEKFRAARGGVLFIDEAYSLLEDHNSYGTEAINTIVQMMENFRDEVIVIFAGYPNKMQSFLEKNEGLRSRIAFHLDFPDYNAEELTDIMKLMVSEQGYEIGSDEAVKKCLSICDEVCGEKDFGNGRFVRNLLEHAIMRQSNRLIKENDGLEITKKEAITLLADDFEPVSVKKQHSVTGFK